MWKQIEYQQSNFVEISELWNGPQWVSHCYYQVRFMLFLMEESWVNAGR